MDAEYKIHLLTSARALVTALETDDDQEIENQLVTLNHDLNNSLFLEVGKLTRALHAAINNFNVDGCITHLTQINIPDTRARLYYIVDLTEQAAHKTLEAVESASLAVQTLSESTHQLQQCSQTAISNRKLSSNITAYLSSYNQHIENIRTNLSEISLAQAYQDLTGQVIRQVTDLIEEVEINLVQLIKTAGQQHLTKQTAKTNYIDPIKAEGPQMNTADNSNIMTKQDDVDELLSSLGF